jgi:hypothetical protein
MKLGEIGDAIVLKGGVPGEKAMRSWLGFQAANHIAEKEGAVLS